MQSDDQRTTVALQGMVQFNGAEALLDYWHHTEIDSSEVVLDVSRVHSITDVGRRMVLEGLRRLELDGHTVLLHDPEGLLPDTDYADAGLRNH